MIFFDRSDIEAIILGGHSFISVLRAKLRRAGAEGTRYFPFEPGRGALQIEILPVQDVEEDDVSVKVLILVEGAGGRTVVKATLEKLGQIVPTFARSEFRIGTFANLEFLDEALKRYQGGTTHLHGIAVILARDLGKQFVFNSSYVSARDTLRRYSRQVGKLPIRVLPMDESFQKPLSLRRRGASLTGNLSILADFLGSLGDPTPWDGEACGAVRTALESAEWDFDEQCVRIWVDEGDRGRQRECASVDKLRQVLELIAQEAYYSSVPFEGGASVFDDPDLDSMVNEELEWYTDELGLLGWSL